MNPFQSVTIWMLHGCGSGNSGNEFPGLHDDIFRISSFKEERGLDYPFARSVSFSLGVRF